MMRGLLIALPVLLPAILPGSACATSLDVAPTTLDLRPGAAGLFFVTNHNPRPVTVQIQAMDWRQAQGQDRLAPSQDLFTSPPMVRIAPGARQSVRVLARPEAGPDGQREGNTERAWRLVVSELPEAAADGDGVHVLLQFSVAVFVRHDPRIAPQLSWRVQAGRLTGTNAGSQTVKLHGLAVDGTALPGQELVYLLPGATRDFGPVAQKPLHLRAQEGRSGATLVADVAP